MSSLLQRLSKMYIDIQAGTSQSCRQCRLQSEKEKQKLIGPLPIFHVGEDYEQDKHKVLFIGSVANGWEKQLDGKKLSNPEHTQQLMEKISTDFKNS